MANIEFIFDFGSPNAYLTQKVLPGMAADVGATVSHSLCLLGGIFKLTNNQAPMIAFAKIDNKLKYERLEFTRFLKRHGLSDFNWNPHFPVTTVILMRGAIVAEEEGKLAPYIEAGLKAMWEEGENMADPETFATVMDRHGLDGQHYLARAQEPGIKQKLIENTDAAVARGVFGVPTFFVGEEMFFGKERLGQVIEAAAS
ncbi:MAG: 2-hydroxychromene-2-carboxylate isomerase [Sulfitobacter sp.]|nr:2-hydroxychromene-2-carboxylate isomerase [Sulfitobacter sp.]